ncbi:MAG TPA: response regulator transcription factor [Candidatus Binataceae bacterium]|nr:response regulator transcription factor [Candidatus Binataceae bacterium]
MSGYNNTNGIRVVIADDHRVLRESLKLLLEKNGCEVIGEASTGEEALVLAGRLRPSVILLDIAMPGMGGLSVAHRIAKASPASHILILSAYDDEEYVVEALTDAGAAGYLLKTDAAEELIAAVRAVSAGKQYLSPSIAPILLSRLKSPAGSRSPGVGLTRREREVLRLIGQGATNKEIAQRLEISPKTALVHRENLKQKLNLHTTAAMVRYAIKHKIVNLD